MASQGMALGGRCAREEKNRGGLARTTGVELSCSLMRHGGRAVLCSGEQCGEECMASGPHLPGKERCSNFITNEVISRAATAKDTQVNSTSPVSRRKNRLESRNMATALKLLITLLFIVCVQGSNGQRCGTSSIQVNTINTGATAGGGDSVFEVEVKNTCPCSVKNVRLNGRGFATTVKVDPAVFRTDDGSVYLVNDGGPIASMDTVSFRYAWDHYFQMAPVSLEDDQC